MANFSSVLWKTIRRNVYEQFDKIYTHTPYTLKHKFICSKYIIFNCDIFYFIIWSDNLSACLNWLETYNVTSYTNSNNYAVKFRSLIRAPDIKHQIEFNIWKSNMKVKHEVFTCSTGAQRNPHTFATIRLLNVLGWGTLLFLLGYCHSLSSCANIFFLESEKVLSITVLHYLKTPFYVRGTITIIFYSVISLFKYNL